MKLVCVFISFVFVNVIADIRDYMMTVFITNKQIKRAAELNNNIVGNGLEYVIKTIVYENIYYMGEMNVMITVPEFTNLNNLPQSTNIQTFMQTEIALKLFIPVQFVPNQNFGNLNLTQLGEERRLYTGRALKNIIIAVLDGYEPGLTAMCRFIALWTSTQVPNLFIEAIDVEPHNVCILRDEAGHVLKYRSFAGVYWQVDVNNIDFKIIKLKNQVMSSNNGN